MCVKVCVCVTLSHEYVKYIPLAHQVGFPGMGERAEAMNEISWGSRPLLGPGRGERLRSRNPLSPIAQHEGNPRDPRGTVRKGACGDQPCRRATARRPAQLGLAGSSWLSLPSCPECPRMPALPPLVSSPQLSPAALHEGPERPCVGRPLSLRSFVRPDSPAEPRAIPADEPEGVRGLHGGLWESVSTLVSFQDCGVPPWVWWGHQQELRSWRETLGWREQAASPRLGDTLPLPEHNPPHGSRRPPRLAACDPREQWGGEADYHWFRSSFLSQRRQERALSALPRSSLCHRLTALSSQLYPAPWVSRQGSVSAPNEDMGSISICSGLFSGMAKAWKKSQILFPWLFSTFYEKLWLWFNPKQWPKEIKVLLC